MTALNCAVSTLIVLAIDKRLQETALYTTKERFIIGFWLWLNAFFYLSYFQQ
jgi:hypothetical protein